MSARCSLRCLRSLPAAVCVQFPCWCVRSRVAMSSGAPTVELLYAGNTAAATALKSSVAASGWDGQLGAAEGERVRLAEGPLWDHTTHTLYFIDILGQKLHALRTDSTEQADQHREWSLPAMPGTVTLTEQAGVLLIAMQDGLYVLDTGTGTCVHTGVDCEPGVVDNRCNDGKADPHGRLVVGTMCLDESDAGRGRGGLYSVDGSGSGQWQCRRLLSNMSIPNGLAWSKDGTRFFHADSPTGHIKEYQYDVSTGDIVGEGKIVVRMAADAGLPDGLTIDDEDMLGGGRVCRVNPLTGAVLLSVPVGGGHVSRVSSCTFGGRDLTDLYITTAAPDLLFDYSLEGLAGSVFVARNVGAKGRMATPFRGALHSKQQ